MRPIIRIGALISGGGSNLQAIIDACEAKRIDGQMAFVGADNSQARGLERARQHHIPTFAIDYRRIAQAYKSDPLSIRLPADFDLEKVMAKQHLIAEEADQERRIAFLRTRAVAESALLEQMQVYGFDLLVLAGFMRNLTPYFIDRVNQVAGRPRIMNIHPALLPAFPGVDGYGDTLRYGCKVGGCTVHFIDYGEDTGPIIGQKTFEILEEDTLESVRKKGLELEWQLYPRCIQLFAQQRLKTVKMSYTLPNGRLAQRTIVKIAQRA